MVRYAFFMFKSKLNCIALSTCYLAGLNFFHCVKDKWSALSLWLHLENESKERTPISVNGLYIKPLILFVCQEHLKAWEVSNRTKTHQRHQKLTDSFGQVGFSFSKYEISSVTTGNYCIDLDFLSLLFLWLWLERLWIFRLDLSVWQI